MAEDERMNRSLEEHSLQCREERDRLAAELVQFEVGTKSIGTPEPGETMTRGTLTRMASLRRSIEQLDAVVRACAE